MQLKLANIFRRERHEGRGEAVVLSTPGRGTERIFIDCVTRTSARVLVQCPSRRFKVPSPSLLPCLCHFLWLQEGYEGLAKEASAKKLQGAQFQPLSPDKFNNFLDHFWVQKCVILSSSSTHTVSCSPKEGAQYFQRV